MGHWGRSRLTPDCSCAENQNCCFNQSLRLERCWWVREAWSADQWNESFVLLLLKVIIWPWDVPSVSIDSSLVRVTFLYVSLVYIFSLRLLVKIIQFFVATNRSALAPSGPSASTLDACSFTVSFAFWSSPQVQSSKEKEESDTGRKDESLLTELYSRRWRFASKLWLRVKSESK